MPRIELTENQWDKLRATLVGRFGEDIAQDTLVKLWEMEDCRDIKHLTAFVCTIGARLTVDNLRRKGTQTGSLDQYLEEREGEALPESLIEYADPEAQAIVRENEEERAAILAQLPLTITAMTRSLRHYHIKKLGRQLQKAGVACPKS